MYPGAWRSIDHSGGRGSTRSLPSTASRLSVHRGAATTAQSTASARVWVALSPSQVRPSATTLHSLEKRRSTCALPREGVSGARPAP